MNEIEYGEIDWEDVFLTMEAEIKQLRKENDSSIKWGVRYRLSILGGVTYVLVVARTGTPTVPTAIGVPYGYAPAVTRVLGPTIAMSVTILKL